MTKEEFKHFAHKLPHLPGIYKYIDQSGQLLYIGKEKDLKR